MSRVMTIVGVRMGLNPRGCSAMSGRKNVGGAVANHAEANAADCHAKMHHKEQSTTLLNYADATIRNADSTNLVRGKPIRDLPRVAALAASRNPHPDVAAAMRLAVAARDKERAVLMPAHEPCPGECVCSERLQQGVQTGDAAAIRQCGGHATLW